MSQYKGKPVVDALILAGGLGTRLRNVLKDTPKVMAPVNGKPFLEYLLSYLLSNQINTVIVCTGYMHHIIKNYFGTTFNGLHIIYSQEQSPRGTGGAIKKALAKISSENVLILNGDTFYNLKLKNIINFHNQTQSSLTLAVKPIITNTRYGTVIIKNNRVVGFKNNPSNKPGYINGGLYISKTNIFNTFNIPSSFSFEKDFLNTYTDQIAMFAFISNAFFIDIGIPEDFSKAQKVMKKYLL